MTNTNSLAYFEKFQDGCYTLPLPRRSRQTSLQETHHHRATAIRFLEPPQSGPVDDDKRESRPDNPVQALQRRTISLICNCMILKTSINLFIRTHLRNGTLLDENLCRPASWWSGTSADWNLGRLISTKASVASTHATSETSKPQES